MISISVEFCFALVHGAATAAIALRCDGSRGQFAFLQQRDNASKWNGEPPVQIATDTSFVRSIKL